MIESSPLLGPVIALALWTFVMWTWMYATRLPAMKRTGLNPDPMAPRGEQMAQLPARVRWKADNYNHLLELPIVFYALALALAVAGDVSAWSLGLAWAYVVLRIVHSLWQALINQIETRFVIFAISSLVLFALTVRAAVLIF